jgi:serine/threonine protein kinase
LPPPGRYSHNLDVGEVFETKYEIVRELGSGGFGKVYLAYQQAMDRHVAIKVLKSNLDKDRADQAKDRFLREVKVISRLRHPHTVTIHDFGESAEQNLLYMVLEYVDGEPLNDVLESEGAQQPVRALTLTTQIARSLSEAHNHGVVHRDLKPANIMVTELQGEGDFVKVLDFGIARLLAQSDRDLTRASLDDDGERIIGTPRYMSPEQVRGKDVDARSDIYCLGLLLYEMLVGEPAVRGETTMALITQQVSPDPLDLPQLSAFPESVSQILRRATAKSPDDRYHGADALIEDLQAALRHDYAGDSSGRVARAGSSSSGPLAAHDSAPTNETAKQPTTDDWQDDASNAAAEPLPKGQLNEKRDDEGGLYEPDDLEDTGDRFANAPAPGLDENPFAAEEPPDQRAPPTDEPVQQEVPVERPTPRPADEPRREIGWFGLSLSMMLSLVGLYAAFTAVGALLGGFLTGSTRLLATATIAAFLPVLGALMSSPPDQRRFDNQAPRSNVWSRRLTSIGMMCAGTALLACVAFPSRVLPRLRHDANWFLPRTAAEASVGIANQQVSETLSGAISQPLEAVGLYKPNDFSASPPTVSPGNSRHSVTDETDDSTNDDSSSEPTPKQGDDFGSESDDQYQDW